MQIVREGDALAGGGNAIALFTAVPETSSLLLVIMIGLAGLLHGRRRRA